MVQSESQNTMQLSAILDSLFKDARGLGLGQQGVDRIPLDGVRDKETGVLREYEIHELTISVVGAVGDRSRLAAWHKKKKKLSTGSQLESRRFYL